MVRPVYPRYKYEVYRSLDGTIDAGCWCALLEFSPSAAVAIMLEAISARQSRFFLLKASARQTPIFNFASFRKAHKLLSKLYIHFLIPISLPRAPEREVRGSAGIWIQNQILVMIQKEISRLFQHTILDEYRNGFSPADRILYKSGWVQLVWQRHISPADNGGSR